MEKWKGFYPGTQEMMTRHMLEVIGKNVFIKGYMNANHTVNIFEEEFKLYHYNLCQ